MNLPIYGCYTKSNILWIGNYPGEWFITKVKYEAYVKARVGWHGLKSDDFTDEGPFLVTGSDFTSSGIHWGDCYLCDLNRYEQDPYIQLRNGDLLITKDGTIGKVALVDGLKTNEKATLNSGVFVVRPLINNFSTKFYFWLLQSKVFTDFVDYNKTGSTIVHLYQDTFVNFSYASPRLKEQIQIAAFLDHETAKIDNLIEKQQQLIELLKEKRQAVISHAVTKGLNPDVPMKDSGVEWLGEVPEHWGVTTLRNLIRNQDVFIQDGNHGELHPVAAEYVDEGIPFLMANNVRGSKVDLVECKRISKSRADKLRIGFAKAGDMLLTHKGTVGEVASIPDYIPEPYWMLTPQVTYYRWNKNKYDSKFCAYLFQSKCIQIQLEIIGSKQSTRSYVGLIAQGELIVVIPPLAEQQSIRKRLDIRTSRLEEMLAFAEKNIELMQERRTALISAAVTGKIDVRDWVAPDTQNVEEPQEATA